MMRLLYEPTIVPGIIFILISLPLLKGRVPMNHWYGFRMKQAFVSDDNWYAVNRYGAKQLIGWSVLLILFGVLTLFVQMPSPLRVLPLGITALAATIKTYAYAKTLPG